MELVSLCSRRLIDLKESDERDEGSSRKLKEESWDIQREWAVIEKEDYPLSLRRREGSRQGRI